MSAAAEQYDALAAAFYDETGMMAPGKDVPAGFGGPSYEERYLAWGAWLAARRAADPLPQPAVIHRPGTAANPFVLTEKGRAELGVDVLPVTLPEPVERACERVERGAYVDPLEVARIVARLRQLERRAADLKAQNADLTEERDHHAEMLVACLGAVTDGRPELVAGIVTRTVGTGTGRAA